MTISKLRERVKMQSRAYIADHLGGYKLTWADKGEFWAAIKPMGAGSEQLNTTEDMLPHRYHVRWRIGTQVLRTARLIWRGQNFRFLTMPQEDVSRRWVSAIVQVEKEAPHE